MLVSEDLEHASHLQRLGVLNPQTVTGLVDEHLPGQRHYKAVLWVRLVSFFRRIGA